MNIRLIASGLLAAAMLIAVSADPFAQGRDLCFPISREEKRVNPNFAGT